MQRYRRGPELAEDLMQVGYVGLLKAINNFGPAFGRSLAVCARPCIADQHRMPSSPPGLSSRVTNRMLRVPNSKTRARPRRPHAGTQVELRFCSPSGARSLRRPVEDREQTGNPGQRFEAFLAFLPFRLSLPASSQLRRHLSHRRAPQNTYLHGGLRLSPGSVDGYTSR